MDYSSLNYDLLLQIGLQTTRDNLIIDQDTYNLLQMNGKSIKYNVPDNMIDRHNEVQFCPAKSLIQAKYLLGYYLDKLAEERGIVCTLQYILPSKDSTYTVVLKFNNDQDLVSNTFLYNEALCYIDLIFKLDNIHYNLTQYDLQVK